MPNQVSTSSLAFRNTIPGCPLEVAHIAPQDCAALCEDAHVLAVVAFDECADRDPAQPARLTIGLPAVGVSQGLAEVWRSAAPVRTEVCGDVTLRVAGNTAFGHILLDETDYGDLQSATYAAYLGMLRAVNAHGFPHLLRVWHYFPDIHGVENGAERYQAFCVGRHQALSGHDDFERTLPAATAIGSKTPGLLIYFIAAASPGTQVENPRQVSAFRYPRQYGPRSPSFSRAVHRRAGDDDTLFISGTASVRGHRTEHEGDVNAQLDETLENLRTVMAHATRTGRGGLRFPEDLRQLKVYLRNPDDYQTVASALGARVGPAVPTLYLHGDVCRTDLLLEIEAVCSSPAR